MYVIVNNKGYNLAFWTNNHIQLAQYSFAKILANMFIFRNNFFGSWKMRVKIPF